MGYELVFLELVTSSTLRSKCFMHVSPRVIFPQSVDGAYCLRVAM